MKPEVQTARKKATPLPSTLLHKAASWIISPIHLLVFVITLCLFHFPLIITHKLFGQTAFDRVLQLMNLILVLNMRLAGTRIHVEQHTTLPPEGPVIYVANHQSMYDIPFLIWYLRARMPRFIAKIELRQFLPSISFSLRHGRHLLINRNEPKEALVLIRKYAESVKTENETVCIFPEGTRAREGQLKLFKPAGLATLVELIPNATVIPICIDGTWRLVLHSLLPIPFGEKVDFHILAPRKYSGGDSEQFVEGIESEIRETLGKIRGT